MAATRVLGARVLALQTHVPRRGHRRARQGSCCGPTAATQPGGAWARASGRGRCSGGAGGGWVENGRRIIYGDLDSHLFSVNVAAQGANLVIGAPRPIFGGRPIPDVLAVAKDGQRFLAAIPQEESTSPMLVLVSDWTSGLKTR